MPFRLGAFSVSASDTRGDFGKLIAEIWGNGGGRNSGRGGRTHLSWPDDCWLVRTFGRDLESD